MRWHEVSFVHIAGLKFQRSRSNESNFFILLQSSIIILTEILSLQSATEVWNRNISQGWRHSWSLEVRCEHVTCLTHEKELTHVILVMAFKKPLFSDTVASLNDTTEYSADPWSMSKKGNTMDLSQLRFRSCYKQWTSLLNWRNRKLLWAREKKRII